jgi:hypothetical protein
LSFFEEAQARADHAAIMVAQKFRIQTSLASNEIMVGRGRINQIYMKESNEPYSLACGIQLCTNYSLVASLSNNPKIKISYAMN